MKKLLTCLLAVLGLNSACGQKNFENTDVQGFAELVADTNVLVLDVRTASEFADEPLISTIIRVTLWKRQRQICLLTKRLPSIAVVDAVLLALLANWLRKDINW